MGSSDFSIPILDALLQNFSVPVVITQPDKPTGRGKKIKPPKIKLFAEEKGLSVYQPPKLIQEEMDMILDRYHIDLIVVADYGKILQPWLLNCPKFGAINVHASLLPKWRGPSPIQAVILQGEDETGVTIMKMDEGLDTGDILSQRSIKVACDDTAETLSKKLSVMGGFLLVETINKYVRNEIKPIPQDSKQATMTKLIKKEDALLDFYQPAEIIERKIRAYNPWPICYFYWDSGYLRVHKAEISEDKILQPGERGIINKYPCIGTSTKAIILKTVQPAGKKIMDGMDFLNGAKNWKAL